MSGAFSPDGHRLVTAEDNKLKLWDAQTGQELFFLKQQDAWLVAFSSDGHKLAAVFGYEARVTIYDAMPLPEKP
jgi:WD40 repeat protein